MLRVIVLVGLVGCRSPDSSPSAVGSNKPAPTPRTGWSVQIGNGTGWRVVVDPHGGACAVGDLAATARAGSPNIEDDDHDGFVTCATVDGKLRWKAALTGPGWDQLEGIAIAENGDIVVAGGFGLVNEAGSRPVEGAFAGRQLTSVGKSDIVVARFHDDGTLVWIKQLGAVASEHAQAVAIDTSGRIVIVADTYGALEVAGTQLGGRGRSSGAVIALTGAGEPIWATGISSEEAVAPVGLALGPDGSVYVTGYFVKSISVGTQTVTGGEQDAYVLALSPQGALRWMHTLKGQGRNGGDGVAVDANAVYVAGSFSTSVTFAGAAHASQGGEDGFIASYGLDGSERSFHDYGANGDDDLRSLTIEGRELHATGTTHGSRKIVTDDRLPGVPITELGPMDYVALGLSLDGKEVWRHDFGRDWATSIAVDPDGVAYIAGRVGTQAVLAQLPHR